MSGDKSGAHDNFDDDLDEGGAKGAKGKKERKVSEADMPRVRLARAISRMVWEREFKASNPDADAAERREAWKSNKGEYIRLGRKVTSRLAKAGFVITAPETPVAKPERPRKAAKA